MHECFFVGVDLLEGEVWCWQVVEDVVDVEGPSA